MLALFLILSASTALANSCPELEDKPALSTLHELRQKRLIRDDREESEPFLNLLLDIYNQNKTQVRKQLQYSINVIRSIRQKEIDDIKAALLEFDDYRLLSADKLDEHVRGSQSLDIYDRMIIQQILRFKAHYFVPTYVNTVFTSTPTNLIVAVLDFDQAQAFTTKININGDVFELTFKSERNLETFTGTHRFDALPVHESLIPEGVDLSHEGKKIQFFSIQIK